MSSRDQKYVFGPAPSRRLGRSLGIDLVPFKTCAYDCVYCQLGSNPKTSIARKEYAPVPEVIRQLEEALARGAEPDAITVSGSGEPTLHLKLGEAIRAIKELTEVPVAVLTSGALLHLPEVRSALKAADIVVPDLDAGSPEVFTRLNRPHPGLRFDDVIEGLKKFSDEYQGQLLIEVFVAAGLNDADREMKKIAAIARGLQGRVQLNTVSRPPADALARPVPKARLIELARLFTPAAEVIADFQAGAGKKKGRSGSEAEVLALLARRPCTLADVSAGLMIPPAQAKKFLAPLLSRGQILQRREGGKTYFQIC